MEFEIRSGAEAMDFVRVHGWLTTAYWSPGVTQEKVEQAAHNSSLVLGAFVGSQQIGYLRVVSDKTTFAWVCDVFVDESHRGRGVAQALVRNALEDSDHQDMRRWLLATRDAHKTYAAVGFVPLESPERWMLKGKQVTPA